MSDDELLHTLPLKRTWLDDIASVFMKRPDGIAEVDAVVIALLKKKRDMGSEGEATVTRTINNFCINAADAPENVRFPLFERVGPAKYKLFMFLSALDLIEIQNIQFDDVGYQKVWEIFVENAKKKPKWEGMSKRERLVAFARNLKQSEPLQNLLKVYGRPPIDL